MYSRILIPIDGSATGERGLHEGIEVASAMKAKIVLLHVVDSFALMVETASIANFEHDHETLLKLGDALLDKASKGAAEAGVESERVLRDVKARRVSDVVLEEAVARRCDLVVMGTHGRKGLRRLALGSDADRVVRAGTLPVLLVRQPEARA